MSEVIYSLAVPEDAAAIVEFQIAMARETEEVELDRDICTEGVAAVFADSKHGFYLVGEQDGQVVASTLITYEWSDWRNGVVWWIQSVYVRPEHRGRRVYAGLYDFVRAQVADNPLIRGIRLYVDRRNTAAQQVYAKLGMNGE